MHDNEKPQSHALPLIHHHRGALCAVKSGQGDHSCQDNHDEFLKAHDLQHFCSARNPGFAMRQRAYRWHHGWQLTFETPLNSVETVCMRAEAL